MLAIGLLASAIIVLGTVARLLYVMDEFTPRNYFDD